MKKAILFLILLLCFSCKDNTKKSSVKNNSKTKHSEANSTKTTTDTILKKKAYFFDDSTLCSVEWEYNQNGLNKTAYYRDSNHQKIIDYNNDEQTTDTIFDINNDGIKDVILLYSGNSIKTWDVYLLDKKTWKTSKQYRLYNYFPIKNNEMIEVINWRSDIVRMKKMKWTGNNIDTIEKINFSLHEKKVYHKLINDKDPFTGIDSKCNNCDADKYDKSVKTIKLKTLPKEYQQALKKYYPEFHE